MYLGRIVELADTAELFARPTPSLYPGAARVRADAGARPRHPGNGARPRLPRSARSAAGLPVPPALPGSRSHVCRLERAAARPNGERPRRLSRSRTKPGGRSRMTRDAAIARAEAYFDTGRFRQDLARRVAMPTESQNPERASVLVSYLEDEMKPALEQLGFRCRTLEVGRWPFLFAERDRGSGSADRVRLRPRRRHPRSRRRLVRGSLALVAHRARRSLVRARRRRQQGPAFDQHRSARGRARKPGQARLQRQIPDRDGRGDGLARPARALRTRARTCFAPTC